VGVYATNARIRPAWLVVFWRCLWVRGERGHGGARPARSFKPCRRRRVDGAVHVLRRPLSLGRAQRHGQSLRSRARARPGQIGRPGPAIPPGASPGQDPSRREALALPVTRAADERNAPQRSRLSWSTRKLDGGTHVDVIRGWEWVQVIAICGGLRASAWAYARWLSRSGWGRVNRVTLIACALWGWWGWLFSGFWPD
jgi:hypothetical protein